MGFQPILCHAAVASRLVESPDEDFGIDPDLARGGVGASERSVALLHGSAEFDEGRFQCGV